MFINLIKRSLFVLYLCLYSTFIMAQKATISGYINDENGETLIGATVYETATLTGTNTNQYGFFSLALPTGNTELKVAYVGFQSKSVQINLNRDTTLNIRLLPEVYQQFEVVVIASDYEPMSENVQLGSVKLTPTQIKKIPSITGEPDVLKALSMTPGVSNGREGAAGLYVRGGTPDQNLILLDEAIVYNPNHLFGLLSVFNPDAIKSIELIKGGFPARYGGRLSSVLDIATREGNTEKLRGNFGIGVTSSRFSLDGPIKKDKTSFMFSGRSAYLDVIGFPAYLLYKSGDIDQYFSYTMYDVNAKLSHRFNDKNRLIVSFYTGKDNYRGFDGTSGFEENKFALIWGNTTATIRNTTILSPKLFWKNMLIYSKFDYQLKAATEDFIPETNITTEFKSLSGLRDYTFKSAFDYIPSPNHYIKFGIEATHHLFAPQTNELTSTDTSEIAVFDNTESIPAIETAIFVEDEWRITKHFKANIGLRHSSFTVNEKTYTSLEPRLSLLFSLPKNFALKAAYSSTQQYLHLLTNTGAGLQNDIWVPTTERITPQQGVQYSVAVVRSLPQYSTDISIEGYYKKSRQLIDFREGVSLQLNAGQNWQDLIETDGEGTSYGIELQTQKSKGKLTGILAYTLSWHTRQFERINNGEKYPFQYDNRHSFSVTANYILSEHWDVSGTWVYTSGNPISLPVAAYDTPSGEQSIPAFIDRNNFRLPNYHRADIAFNHTKTTKRQRERTWTMGIYNLYYRKNIYYARLVNQYVGYEDGVTYFEPQLKAFSLLPIVPSVSYSLEF